MCTHNLQYSKAIHLNSVSPLHLGLRPKGIGLLMRTKMCLSIHLMCLKVLHKGPLCYSVTKRHSLKVQYLCAVYANEQLKKLQPLSQSDKLKTKMKLFYLFLYYGEIQRETVARTHCYLTLNLCTKTCVQNMKKHIRTRFRVSVQT